ncbi:MAG: hypothetical protein ACOCX5_01810 [Chloroflexota bacterium]
MVSGRVIEPSPEHHMDETLMEFLRTKVNSFIKWDLVRFFHDNPHTKDTAENLARYTGRDVRTVERELKGLVTSGVLVSEQLSNVIVYQLANDDVIRGTINRFMEACHDRHFRVRAINQVIQGMQFSPRHDF